MAQPKIDRRGWLAWFLQKRRRARAGVVTSPVTLRTGLAAYWDLNEVDDEGWLSRSDKLGMTPVAAYDTPIVSGPGILNLGAVYTGERGLLGDAARLSVAADFSLSIWLYLVNYAAAQAAFQLYDSVADAECFQLWCDAPYGETGGNVYCVLDGVGGGSTLAWLPVNLWHHLVVAVNGNTLSLYANGGLADTVTLSAAPRPTADQVQIGARSNGYGWLGSIDEVGFWNRGLTADEVAQLYNNGSGLAYEMF
jgi:hypothetical protein